MPITEASSMPPAHLSSERKYGDAMRQTIASVELRFFTNGVSWEQISGQKDRGCAAHCDQSRGLPLAGAPCRFDDIDPTMATRGKGAGSINLSGQISGLAGDSARIHGSN
jgi:hypothetical protein